jgi:hypothetical protein
MESLNFLVMSMEEFLVKNGYVKVSGEGLGSKYCVPRRGIYTGDVYFLKQCVDFELECMSGSKSKLVNPAHL